MQGALSGYCRIPFRLVSIACWIAMFSVGHRRLAAAFVTNLSGNVFSIPSSVFGPGRGAHLYRLRPLELARAASKSTSKRMQSLVVHGPPEFSVKQKRERPFKLVIVESPSKCETISKILQEHVKVEGLDHDYVVTSCMGHIRNIPQQKTDKEQQIAGIDLEGGRYEPVYTILPEKTQLVEDLTKLAMKAHQLILATDDDREGEAMAWHLLQVLLGSDSKSDTDQLPPLRVRFTEITPKAITDSIFRNAHSSLRENLVLAQETRRILDRLAGFTVSPVLWKKIAPGLSAGRVQSVGMALIVQRERERLLFKESEYWDVAANFTAKGITFPGTMVSLNESPIVSGGSDFEPLETDKLTPKSSHKFHLKEKEARNLVLRFETEEWTWTIEKVTESQRKLHPPAPFITSTLQQEANNRLGLSVMQTMRTAQQLYEQGFISYMRTDSSHLSDAAKEATRTEIVEVYGGPEYYEENAIQRNTKRKGKKKLDPQGAHEAIRPAIQPDGRFALPESLPSTFDGAAKELYQMIYQGTVASHMPPQVSKQTTIRIRGDSTKDGTSVGFRASGNVIISPGYMIVYPSQNPDGSSIMPELMEGSQVERKDAGPIQHLTQPPARYTEASFVQELEALGVGRPSTYAGTVQILRDRAYAGSPVSGDGGSRRTKEVSGPAISAKRAAGGEEFTGSARGPMVPSLTAFAVCSMLEKYCNMYVDPSFTAKMEERLDQIAQAEEIVGDDQRISYLDEFYAGDEGLAAQIRYIEERVDADDVRRVNLPSLASESADVGLFVGPWGPYVRKVGSRDGKDSDDKAVTAQLPPALAADLSAINLNTLNYILCMKEQNGLILGQHPEDGRTIRCKVGRFGAFLQWGDDGEEGTTTHTLPSHLRQMKNIDTADPSNGLLGLEFEEAVQYVNLPRTVCEMDGSPIIAALGPYGPYLKYNNTFVSLRKGDGDVLTIDPETAVLLVNAGMEKKSSELRGPRCVVVKALLSVNVVLTTCFR
jgi:DNA topoisomerase I